MRREANCGPAAAGEARVKVLVPISLLGLDSALKDLPLFVPLIEDPPHQTDRFELFFRMPIFGIRGLSTEPAPEETPLVDDPAGDGRLEIPDEAEGSTKTSLAKGPT